MKTTTKKEDGNIQIAINVQEEKKKYADVPALCKKADLVISNQAELDLATDVLKEVKARYKELDSQRKAITQPIDLAKKNVMALYNPVLELLENAERKIKAAIVGYTNKKEEEARAEQARLQKLAEQEAEKERKKIEAKIERAKASGKEDKVEELEAQKDAIIPIDVPVITPQVDTPKDISYREKWSAIVVDEKLIPREYLIVNQSALDKVAQATKGSLSIPGVKFEMKKVVVAA